MGLPFLLTLLVGPPVSTVLLKLNMSPSPTFAQLFLHAFGLMFFFNLVDLLILDWLIFCAINPRWIVVPGTENAPEYKDYGYHLIAAAKGAVFSVLFGLVVARLVTLV